MTAIQSVTLEVSDPVAAAGFYDAFAPGPWLQLRAASGPSTGFRGFSLSLVVPQPATVDTFLTAALAAGATTLKPTKLGFWGYGGVIQAPDGAIWKVATSAKKNTGPAVRQVDDSVLLLGVANVKASKQFYLDHGFTVRRSFGSKYVEFDAPASAVKLALYTRRAAAKDVGVDPAGGGSHRFAIGGGTGSCTDPDGFVWEHAPVLSDDRAGR